MNKKYDLETIRKYWSDQALKYGLSYKTSWSDYRVIEMEIKEIIKYISEYDNVLDVGCGNGFSTIQIASQKNINIRGIDYIPEMIEQARFRAKDMENRLIGKVAFDVADISYLGEFKNEYDKLIIIRVIINLGDWKLQVNGLRQCIKLIKKGGLLLLSEATLQGWNNLNKLRKEWELNDIPMPLFNNYIDEDKLIKEVSSELELKEINNFSSTYFIGTRIIKPLIIKLLGDIKDVSDPGMEINRLFSLLPSWGDYGTQKLFVFEKK